MLFKTQSAAVYGIDASIIEVEVDVSPSRAAEDNFQTVGLPDAAVRESRQRIRAALRNCGYEVPLTQITINLAPADIKKEGSGFDLPMAHGNTGRVWRPGEERAAGICNGGRAVARWRHSRRTWRGAHCHRSA